MFCFQITFFIIILSSTIIPLDAQDSPLCPLLPTVDPSWREPDTKLDFPTQFPLTPSELNSSFPSYGVNRLRLAKVIHRLATKKERIAIGIFGGSFSKGAGCCGGSQYHRLQCSWHHRVVRWLRAAYPKARTDIISYATGSTSSMYGLRSLEENLNEEFDIIFWDYSCNDIFSRESDSAMENARVALESTIEMVIRTALSYKNHPLIIFFSEYLNVNDMERLYDKVCALYGIPHLKYRSAVWEHVKDSDVETIYWPTRHWGVHPPWPAHQLIADMFTSYWTQEARWACEYAADVAAVEAALNTTLPAPFLYNPEEVEAGRCQFSQLFSLLPEDAKRNAKPLEPWRGGITPTYPGWVMKSDRRGKSLGWIAENLCGPGVVTEHSASPENDPPLGSHIVFHFQVIRGIITINYLSTYKNAGKVEIWVSRSTNYDSNGGFREKKQPGDPSDILLVHTAKQSGYGEAMISKSSSYFQLPYKQGLKNHEPPQRVMDVFTHSAYIDAFQSAHNVSENAEKTFHFAVSGEMLLHIRHLPLSQEECQRRGGDKFKLISIRVC